MSGANNGKAFFTNTDTGAVFRVQFNPKEFKLDEKANWKASGEHASSKPLLTYEKGEPSTLTMDLIFDTTDEPNKDVYKAYVEPLRDFLTADVPQKDAQGKPKGERPPYCMFTWGNFTFDCVVEKVSCTFLMFKSDGTPIRAKVQVGLKERSRPNTSTGPGGGVVLTAGALVAGSGSNAKSYTTKPGDTLSSVAARTGASPQDIALANHVNDPLQFPPNTQLVIPATPELAQVLAQQRLKHTPAYWKNDRKLEPYDVFAVPAGNTAYVPSAFEEEGPIAQEYGVPAQPQIPYASFNQTYGDYAASRTTISAFTPQEYGDYGESEFTFGKTSPQTYGDYGPSEIAGEQGDGFELGVGFGPSENTFGTSGQGAGDYGGYAPSEAASGFSNDAKPIEQGATAQGQEYGGYGPSENTFGTSGQGAEYGGYGESEAASAFDNDANPIAQGATAEGQSYGGYGESENTFGTSGQGAGGYGGYGESEAASSFSNDANPIAQGATAEGQVYGGYANSENTFGTSAQGANLGTPTGPAEDASQGGGLSSQPRGSEAGDSLRDPGATGASTIAQDGAGGPNPAIAGQTEGIAQGTGSEAAAGGASSAAVAEALRRAEETAKKSKE